MRTRGHVRGCLHTVVTYRGLLLRAVLLEFRQGPRRRSRGGMQPTRNNDVVDKYDSQEKVERPDERECREKSSI